MKKLIYTLILIFCGNLCFSQDEKGIKTDSVNTVEPERRAIELIDIAWGQIENKNFTGAIASCKEGLAIDEESQYLLANLAHAYLFSGNFDEAIAIYRKYYGQPFSETMTWKEMVKSDFETFTSKGFDTKEMDKVVKDLQSFE
jgi:Tfp pilus assembly protein PilF